MGRAQPRPERVLWVAPVSNLAGVARHIIDVCRVGIPGRELVVAAPEGPLLDRVRALEGRVVPVEIGPGVRPDLAVRRLRRVITQVEPGIVHSHLARADLLAAMAGPLVARGTRLVSTEHHIAPDRFMFHPTLWRAMAMESVHHLRLTRFAALIAVSDSTRRDMSTYWQPGQPITVIRNGVDRPEVAPARAPGLRFLSLCRLSPEKNVEMSVRAFAAIVAAEPTARLTVAGTGQCADGLRQLTRQLGIEAAVTFPGHVDPAEALASHDVVLQPSKSDNLSYTLLDAMVAGLGVAASPIGGNPEVLPDHCLADLDDLAGFVEVALDQARRVDRRPRLPDQVPTVAGMAGQVAEVYDRVQQ